MSITRPVQLPEFQQSLSNVSEFELFKTHDEVVKSINKLNESNLLMLKELKKVSAKIEKLEQLGDSEELQELRDDHKLYQESMNENLIVIENNFQRELICNEEMRKRNLNKQMAQIMNLSQLVGKINGESRDELKVSPEEENWVIVSEGMYL